MDPLALTAAGIVVGVQVGLFAWLKHDISDVARGLARSECGTERYGGDGGIRTLETMLP